MNLQPEVLRAVTIIVIVLIVCLSLVAVLAPAALGAFVRPLLETISKLIDALTSAKKPPDDPPPSA
jgi:hypothetical protein